MLEVKRVSMSNMCTHRLEVKKVSMSNRCTHRLEVKRVSMSDRCTHMLEVKRVSMSSRCTYRLEVKRVSMASREVMQSTILPGMMSGGRSRLSQEVVTSRIHGTKMCHTKRLFRRCRRMLTLTVEKQNSVDKTSVDRRMRV